MARSRNLKPGYFKNEALAECTPLARLLFAGLWCLADRDGRLEDRPKRIRAEVLPYDDGSVDAMLDELHKAGFILRYQHGEQRFIQVVNFAKHQNPHVREPKSTIPAPGEHKACTVPAQDEHRTGPADSLLLIPSNTCAVAQHDDEPESFAECWKVYPKREGGNPRKPAMKAYKARVRQGVSPADLLAGTERYAAFIRAKGQEGTAYVKQAATFYGPDEHWREPWDVADQGGDGIADNPFAGAI